jgi:hypothetical protein
VRRGSLLKSVDSEKVYPTSLERFGKAEGHWQVNYFFCDAGYPGQRCVGLKLPIGVIGPHAQPERPSVLQKDELDFATGCLTEHRDCQRSRKARRSRSIENGNGRGAAHAQIGKLLDMLLDSSAIAPGPPLR